MRAFRAGALALGAMVLALGGSVASVVHAEQPTGDDSAQVVLDWNQNTIGAFVKSGGPGAVASLALAMVHGAIYDAVVSIAGGYQPYLGTLDADPTASKVAAAASAAHDVLAAMYPDQAADLQALLDTSLGNVPDGRAKEAGVAVG